VKRTVAGVALVLGAAAGWACRTAEPLEHTRLRAQKHFLQAQIAGLEDVVGRAERGEMTTLDDVAIGVDEGVVQQLLSVTLPIERVVGQRLRIRIDSARPLFRGNQAAVTFRARAASEDLPSAYLTLELAGTLGDFRLEEGRLTTHPRILHFGVVESSVGTVAASALQELVRANLPAIEAEIPSLEIPVQLEQSVRIAAERLGPITVRPGELPLKMAVDHVLPVNQRLWILISVTADPWKQTAAAPP
jgi:hypothetical protein